MKARVRGVSSEPIVLLVESVQDDRAMYAEYLRASGFHAVEIGNTLEALTSAAAADLIVTGIRVPGTFDGVELVRRLRRDERTRAKPIIVLTACAYEPERQRAVSAGCDVFLPKPCMPDVLRAKVRHLLAQSRALRQQGEKRQHRTMTARLKSEVLSTRS